MWRDAGAFNEAGIPAVGCGPGTGDPIADGGVAGRPAPFCSCEVIPFVAALLALGAPVSAIMAFWLSSPLIDPATALITAAALGWEFAAGKAVAAVALGLAGGFAVRLVAPMPAFAAPLAAARAGCGGSGARRPVSRPSAPRRRSTRASLSNGSPSLTCCRR